MQAWTCAASDAQGTAVARLTQDDVSRLVAALGETTPGRFSGQPETFPAAATRSSATIVAARQKLRDLGSSGELGPVLTQRLAAYLGKPIRCTCAAITVGGSTVCFQAQAGDAIISVGIQTALASMLADAMLGGEGDPKSVGFNPRVIRLAASPALEMLRALAAAAGLPQPTSVEEASGISDEPVVSGSLALGTQEHAWEAGLAQKTRKPDIVATQAPLAPAALSPPATAAELRIGSPLVAHGQTSTPSDLDRALENARRRLSELLGTDIAFERETVLSLERGEMPHGWMRLGLPSHQGGAIVLAVERQTAIALMRMATRSASLETNGSGLVSQTGVEIVLRDVLCALAAALGSAQEELHHVVRLSDEAIVADLAHVGVEHDVTSSGESGRMRWLVPAHLVRPSAGQPGRG